MSSPYSRKTKKGMEETIEALKRASIWASRIDTKNDATNIDTDFIEDLDDEENRLRRKHKIKTTELAVDNFVFNNRNTTVTILTGDLDERVSALNDLSSYISDDFGYVRKPSLSKEELVWLVAQEVMCQKDTIDEYNEDPVDSLDLEDLGSTPEIWDGEDFPIHNRS